MKGIVFLTLILISFGSLAGGLNIAQANDIATLMGKDPADLTSYAGKAMTAISTIMGGGVAGAPACDDTTGMIAYEDAEGVGTPSGWADSAGTGGTVDWDDTTATILRGSQQLEIYGSSSSGTISTATLDLGSSYSTINVHFKWKGSSATPSETQILCQFLDVEDGIAYSLQFRTNGAIRMLNTGAGTLGTTVGTFDPTANQYHVWMEYTKGTGANAVWALYIGTSNTKPGSAELSGSEGNMTYDIRKIQFTAKYTHTQYYDQIRVDSDVIGNVCE